MADLEDYAGDFDPNLRFENFSKDVLVRLLKLYSKMYYSLDGFWYLSVKDRVNNDEALACDLWVWERLTKQSMVELAELLKINRNGVEGMMKALQVSPWAFIQKSSVEFKDKNHAILTYTYCPTLEALEREGEGRERVICREVEVDHKRRFADVFNSTVEVTPLKLPPRKSGEEICCQWEFKLR